MAKTPAEKLGKDILALLVKKGNRKVPTSELRDGCSDVVVANNFSMGLTWLAENRYVVVSKKDCVYTTTAGKKLAGV